MKAPDYSCTVEKGHLVGCFHPVNIIIAFIISSGWGTCWPSDVVQLYWQLCHQIDHSDFDLTVRRLRSSIDGAVPRQRDLFMVASFSDDLTFATTSWLAAQCPWICSYERLTPCEPVWPLSSWPGTWFCSHSAATGLSSQSELLRHHLPHAPSHSCPVTQ